MNREHISVKTEKNILQILLEGVHAMHNEDVCLLLNSYSIVSHRCVRNLEMGMSRARPRRQKSKKRGARERLLSEAEEEESEYLEQPHSTHY